MRWSRLFDDLEAQLAEDERRELGADVAEHVRAERAQIGLVDRLVAAIGAPVVLSVQGVGDLPGLLQEVGADWCLARSELEGPDRTRDVLIPVTALTGVSGLPAGSDARPGASQRRFPLGHALRAVSRDRAAVRIVDVVGGQRSGTIDRVGSDHLDLADHADDLPRRPAAVRTWHTLPFAGVATVRRL